jgi:hypothetical protein
MPDRITKDVQRISAKIAPLLAGKPSPIQGAVLAELVAIWLVGHFDEDGPTATARLHNSLLEWHVKTVLALVDAEDGE